MIYINKKKKKKWLWEVRPEPHFQRQEPNSLWCYLKKIKSASCSVTSDSFLPRGLMNPETEPTLALLRIPFHGILQARILEWVAIPSSRASSWPSDWTQVSLIVGRFFTVWATRVLSKRLQILLSKNIFLNEILLLLESAPLFKSLPETGNCCLEFQLNNAPGLLSCFTTPVVAQSLSCVWLFWDPMDCSMPGFPVHYQLPEAYSNSWPMSRWCHLTISFSVIPFSSCLQSFLAWESFKMSQFFASGGQSIGASASASVPPMNIQIDFF